MNKVVLYCIVLYCCTAFSQIFVNKIIMQGSTQLGNN